MIMQRNKKTSSLTADSRAILEKLKKSVPRKFKKTIDKMREGAGSRVDFFEVPGVYVSHHDNEVKDTSALLPQPLYIAEAKLTQRGEKIASIAKRQQMFGLLAENNIPHVYLSYPTSDDPNKEDKKSSEEWYTWSEKGTSLRDWVLLEKPLALSEVQDLLGQMLFKCNQFHLKKVVHTDISRANFLLMPPSFRICLELMDFDSIYQVDDLGLLIDSNSKISESRRYSSKELNGAGKEKNKVNLKINAYYSVGRVMLDCLVFLAAELKSKVEDIRRSAEYVQDKQAWAEGKISEYGIYLYPEPKVEDKVKDVALIVWLYALHVAGQKNPVLLALFNLIVGLLQEKPASRWTFEKAMESDFFPPGYFNLFEKEKRYRLFIDGIEILSQRPLPQEFFLPPAIKSVAKEADMLLDQVDALEENTSQKKLSPDINQKLDETIKELRKKSSAILSSHSEYASEVGELTESVAQTIKKAVEQQQVLEKEINNNSSKPSDISDAVLEEFWQKRSKC